MRAGIAFTIRVDHLDVPGPVLLEDGLHGADEHGAAAPPFYGVGRESAFDHECTGLSIDSNPGLWTQALCDSLHTVPRSPASQPLRHQAKAEPGGHPTLSQVMLGDPPSGIDEDLGRVRSAADELEQAGYLGRAHGALLCLVTSDLIQDHARKSEATTEVQRKVGFGQDIRILRGVEIPNRRQERQGYAYGDGSRERGMFLHMGSNGMAI